MIEREKFSTMTVEQALDILTDWNWHTERVLIEAILSGDSELINDMLIVALHHGMKGYLVDEMQSLRKQVMYKLAEKGEM